MYLAKQVEPLFHKIQTLVDSASDTGCEGSLTVVDSTALQELRSEVRRLSNMTQKLILGRHEHAHGDSLYLFLVPDGVVFDTSNLALNLDEQFEPAIGEKLSVESMGTPVVFDEI